MASLHFLRLRQVFPLLALFFVAGPLLMYHFSTFDFQHVSSLDRRARSVSSTLLPRCLDVSSRDFLTANAAQKLQSLCGVNNTTSQSKLTSKLRLVHFVHVAEDAVPLLPGEHESDREQFTYLQFAALQSVRRALEPDIMMMHYLEPPRGVWYTQCQRHLGLHQVLPPVSFTASGLNHPKRRRVIETLVMLRVLKKHGGVAFSDFNTFLLRAINVNMDEELVLAGQSASKTFALGLHVIQASAGHPFVSFLEEKIIDMVEKNDSKLHRMPLDEAVGQIVLEKYLEERGAVDTENNGTLTPGNSVMDGVAIANGKLFGFNGLHDLLTEKIGPSLAGKFRHVAGFHVDKYNFAQQAADTVDLREIGRMQKELTMADEWKGLDSLLGAVVRLAVTANTTAELDPLFT